MDLNRKKKNEIRKQMRALKSKVSFEEKKARSAYIFGLLEAQHEYVDAKTVLMYWSMEDEVYTHDFVIKTAQTKKVILPSIAGNTLQLKEFTGISELVSGDLFNIPEPKGEIFTREEEIDLVIVPGVAFDEKGNRLGRGKAYYDNLLKRLDAFKIGVCFDYQYIKEIPVEPHDERMSIIISG